MSDRRISRMRIAAPRPIRGVPHVVVERAHGVRSSTDRLDHLLEHFRDGFLEVGRDWVCVTANRAIEALAETTREAIVGHDVRLVLHLDRNPELLHACERAMRERVAVHLEANHHAALDRWFECDAYPCEMGISLLMRDITARKKADQLRDLVLSIVGHDLRTPLGVISVSSEMMLMSSALPESLREPVARIHRSGARMSEMVTQLLDFTRLHLGQPLSLRRRRCSLAEVCSDVIAELRAANPGCRINCVSSGDLSGQWDTARMAQVISNLIANALQHGAEGGGANVRVWGEPGQPVYLEVHNQGPPIPAELLPRLFHPFLQGRGADAPRNVGSLGLGLFIANSIVRAHGGTITATSSPSDGTRFTIQLPR